MKASRPALFKLLGLFLTILTIYGLAFLLDGFFRMRKGPWLAVFSAISPTQLELSVYQPTLGINGVKITIQREALESVELTQGRVEFRNPNQPLPFGQLIYTDLTFLPGVVTMEIEGHQIELMPRALVVNRKPIPWDRLDPLDLKPRDRLPEGPLPPQRQKQLGREIPTR